MLPLLLQKVLQRLMGWVGRIGGNAHSEEEYLEVASLIVRTELFANVIRRLTVGEV